MLKRCFNYISRCFSGYIVKERRISLLGLTLLYFLSVQTVFGEIADSSQRLDNSRQTLQQRRIVKIEYRIDNLPVIDSEILHNLNQHIHITVGSQLSRHAIQQSVLSLYASQQFSQVEVYIVETTEGVVLKFDLFSMMHIQKIDVSGVPSDELKAVIRSVIRLEPGALYLPVIAESYIDAAKAVCADYGYFDAQVEIKTITDEGNLTYQITLGDPTLIKDIQIHGNTTLFTEHIKEVAKTEGGKVYRKSDIDKDIAAIRDLYSKKYYPNTTVNSEFDSQTGVLTFHVQEGIQLLLDYMDTKGKPIIQATPFRDFLAKLKIINHKSEKDQLRDKITFMMKNRSHTSIIKNRSQWEQIVQSHFEAEGYDGTKVHSKVLTTSPLHVKFTVDVGTRYDVTRVSFDGNTAFTEKELLREMDTKPVHPFSRLIWKRVFSQQTLTRDIQRLVILYLNAGYPDVVIKKPELKKNRDNKHNRGEISIHLTIVENSKEIIHRCQFNGNHVLDNATLLDAFPSKPPEPNASLVHKKYENAILTAYQERGYMDAKVLNLRYLRKMDTPVFEVNGNFAEQLDAGVIPEKLKDEFKKHDLSLAGTRIIATKIGKQWSVQDVDDNARYTLRQERDHLSVFEHDILQFDIDEGDQIIFGKFFFAGDTGVKSLVLKREVAHLQGTLYTPDKLRRAIQNIYGTGIFEPGIRPERKEPTDTEDQHKVNDVLIRLQKRKPGAYGASIGYSTSDGPRGTIAFSHLNLFKRNVRFRLRVRGGTRGYLYDTSLTEPWLIGRTSGSLHFLGRKLEQDDNVRALQGSLSLSRKLSRAHRLNLEYSYRDLKDTSEVAFVTNPSTTVSSLRFLWRIDNRIPSINPTSGILNEWTVEYAGGFLGGKSSFVKVITDTRYHRTLSDRGFVISTALRLGYTTGLLGVNIDQSEEVTQTEDHNAELISFERFWAGGSTTVRGYEERGLGPEDSTGKHRGNVQFIFNTELRFPIFSPFQGILFVDSGNVWGTTRDIEYEWLPSSVGVGLRLNIGPIIGGVDYAIPLVTVQEVPMNPIHFRIGSTF